MRKIFIFSVVLFSFISFQLFGQTWSSPKRLTWTADYSKFPSIATDSGNNIHIVYSDKILGDWEIFYKVSSDGGTNWSGPVRLTWNAGDSFDPALAMDSIGKIHVVWYDDTPGKGNTEIFYKLSTDGGATWSALKRVTWNSGSSYIPSIASDSSSGIHVMWSDDAPGNSEIFYKNYK